MLHYKDHAAWSSGIYPRDARIFQYPQNSLRSVQFFSLSQSCPTLCDPLDCTMPCFPVHYQYPELTQTHVHWVGDAIQPFHPLSSHSSPSFSLSQHQGLFQWVCSSHQVAKVFELQFQHQSFQWIFRTDFNWMLWSYSSPSDCQESSPTLQITFFHILKIYLFFFIF